MIFRCSSRLFDGRFSGVSCWLIMEIFRFIADTFQSHFSVQTGSCYLLIFGLLAEVWLATIAPFAYKM
jgi:hypothetical protein